MNARSLAGTPVVLLVCGSFNPPTYLHLRMFERARDFLQQDCNCRVLEGLMSPVSDHFRSKKLTLTPALHRLKMVELATENSDWIRADSWECQREQWTRTIEVLRHHRIQMLNRYSNEKDLRVILLCGGDLVDSFTKKDENGPNNRLWNPAHLEEIFAQYGLVVIDRAGSNARKTLESEELSFLHGMLENMAIIEDDAFPNEMSSTRLRNLLHCGRSIRYCTPDSVVQYIKENKLYISEDKTGNQNCSE